MTAPTVSVVICTRERPEQLARCLDRVARLAPAPTEIVVVASGRSDAATRAMAERHGARYVVEPRRGVSAVRNTGAMLARADLVAYTDDDAEVDPDWLAAHVDAFADPEVGACTGRILPLGSSGSPARTNHEGDFGTTPFRLDAASSDWFSQINFGRVGIGPNMVFRRSLIEHGLRFDEGIGVGTPIPGCEEHRALSDVVRSGFAVVYLPGSVVRHGGDWSVTEARLRRRRIQTASVAYATMLMIEEPASRPLVVREALRSLRRRPELMQPSVRAVLPTSTARLDAVRALALGPLLYVRTCMQRPGRQDRDQ